MTRTDSTLLRRPLGVLTLSALLVATSVSLVGAQTSTHGSSGQAASQDQPLAKQLEELRAQVAKLQATLDQQRKAAPSPKASMPASSTSGMRMDDKDEMGMVKMPQSSMSMAPMEKGEMGMAPDGMKMSGCMNCMMDDMSRMGGMAGAANNTGSDPMPGAGAMTMPRRNATGTASTPRSTSALPGVPGASHLYHIGSTGFFLDQPHITLTADQQNTLNKVKEKALLDRSNAERRIEQGEQELWTLTGADQPDAAKIEAKAREIEQVRTNQRLAFIQAVGDATKVLTAEQRNHLLGMGGMPAK